MESHRPQGSGVISRRDTCLRSPTMGCASSFAPIAFCRRSSGRHGTAGRALGFPGRTNAVVPNAERLARLRRGAESDGENDARAVLRDDPIDQATLGASRARPAKSVTLVAAPTSGPVATVPSTGLGYGSRSTLVRTGWRRIGLWQRHAMRPRLSSFPVAATRSTRGLRRPQRKRFAPPAPSRPTAAGLRHSNSVG